MVPINIIEPIEAVLEIQNARGSNAKKAVIEKYKDYPWVRMLLYYALNPMLTYKISEQTLLAAMQKPDLPENNLGPMKLFDVCSELAGMKALSNEEIDRVAAFVRDMPAEHQGFLVQLLSKTLRLGVTAKTVNKVIPGLIPEWEVQQAYPIEKYPLKPGTEFWLTQKLNGTRATYYKGKLYARSGVPYEGLDHIINELDILSHGDLVFDGELTLKNRDGISDNEAFRIATGIINSDAENKIEICYTIFDNVNTWRFEENNDTSSYSARRAFLDHVSEQISEFGLSNVSVLPVLYHGTDQSQIDVLLDQMVREDKEGLMVNLDVPYQRKRHRGILKVKRFYTMDLPIIRCEEGAGRLSGTLGALVVDYKGNEIGVGSGFSDEQRMTFWAMRKELPGTLCEVKYKEVSQDKKTGQESLQFPVFVSLRPDKNEVSYG